MGLSAIMNSIFGRGGRKKPVIKFTSSADDPFVQSLTCKGTITIESIKDGNPVVETYSNLTDTLVNIQADADTEITITGNIIKLDFAVYNDDPDVDDYEGCFDISTVDVRECRRLKSLSVPYCENITELNLAANTALQYLDCGSTSITELNLAANTALQYLNCGSTSITELNLAANTALQNLYCNGCTSVSNISYPATNSDVSTAIAGAITKATASDGTVYTDSSAAHYSTIADAATAKGWTISKL